MEARLRPQGSGTCATHLSWAKRTGAARAAWSLSGSLGVAVSGAHVLRASAGYARAGYCSTVSPLIRLLVGTFRAALDARFPGRVERVCLFGSWARGDASETSDIDIAAVIRGLTDSEWREALAIAAEVETSVEAAFSPFVVSSERLEDLRGIAHELATEGVDL